MSEATNGDVPRSSVVASNDLLFPAAEPTMMVISPSAATNDNGPYPVTANVHAVSLQLPMTIAPNMLVMSTTSASQC